MAKTLFLPLSPIMLFLLFLHSFSFHSKSLPQTLQIKKEQRILLKLKREWRNPPSLSNWTMESNGDHCSWPGIKCSTDGSITEIDLFNKNLSFPIPPSICDLTNLTKIDLYDNNIPGPFPIYLSNCSNLQYLDISSNHFVGRLPPDIDRLSSLRTFFLFYNNFTGDIPPEIGHMSNLTELNLSGNLFNGSVPSEIGDLEKLETLNLGDLSIMPQWRIPPEFGRLKKLQDLWLQNSNLIGDIPGFLINLTDLERLVLAGNKLRGEIPRDLFKLKNLTSVFLYNNSFSGEIPRPIDALGLRNLFLSMNQLAGTIPKDFGKLVNLNYLDLSMNQLTGTIPKDFGKLVNLNYLNLSMNQLTGTIPEDFGELVHLEYLGLDNNQLSGEIPASISGLPSLTSIHLENNNLIGLLPPGLGLYSELGYFNVSTNRLSGKLPQNLCHGGVLRRLGAFSNNLSGTLPESLGKCPSLETVRLHCNRFTGEISAILSALLLIQTLELQENRISGEIPSDISSLKFLNTLNLSKNQLTGGITPAFGFTPMLNSLDLSGNQLSGEIPPELRYLHFHKLDLSSNRLTGKIPDELDKPEFETSFLNNSGLCASKSNHNHSTNFNIRSCDSSKISPRVLASISGFLILLILAFLAWFFITRDHKNRKREQRQEVELPTPTWCFTSFHRLDFTEDDILNGLVESNLIGSGGSGKVYRISIGNQTNFMVAVKKIYNSNKSDAKLEKEFQAEIEILGRIRHANIVKLLCCISSQDSKLLVYEYMENGSLDIWLCRKRNGTTIESGPLDWPIRLRIAVDAAQGLCYMHHSCSPPIIHRDVKSSNILLDSEFKARIADFGLARMLIRHRQGEPESMSAIAGTFGYMAPEYAAWARANEKCDVYSFGVVLLELTTGKKACSTCDGCNGLVEWAWHHLQEGKDLVEAFDKELREDPSYLNEMTLVFNLGLNCTVNMPSHRPSMKQALHILQRCGTPQNSATNLTDSEYDVGPLLHASSPSLPT